MSAKLKTLKALPKNGAVTQEPPKLEAEPLHRKLARLTAEQERLTKEIQKHRSAWASRNQIASQTHQTPSTAEITAFKQAPSGFVVRTRYSQSGDRSDRQGNTGSHGRGGG
jgi:hypothetical protein